MDVNTKKIEELLAQKKYDEVRALLKEISSQAFSDQEKGAALTGIASVYIDISNSINIQYRDALKEAISAMSKIDSAENRLSEKVQLAQVRKDLGI